MAINTPSDLIRAAFKTSGILSDGQPPSSEDLNDTLDDINMFMAQWTTERLLVYSLLDISYPMNGSQSYTIGPGQQFNTPRPVRIESAFARLLPASGGASAQTDYYLRIIQSREEYSAIVLKGLTSWPVSLWYDSQFPNGTLYPYPIPQSGQWELHIQIMNQISQFTSLTQPIGLPLVYYDAIFWMTVNRLRERYQEGVSPGAARALRKAMNVLRISNNQQSNMRMPGELTSRRGRGLYDWPGFQSAGTW